MFFISLSSSVSSSIFNIAGVLKDIPWKKGSIGVFGLDIGGVVAPQGVICIYHNHVSFFALTMSKEYWLHPSLIQVPSVKRRASDC